ncbi:acyl carrier protein phosphodiesterase [Kaistella jeonii]|uniref:ACP phosphodiesterase n=1 Tax=Kaistella jeonii TaxID=266749 RepID=A0A0C1EYT1_9FLAO|nr:ACP phosphodiesterase [Kaistella jeonii]KIA85992.1 ACP phosphodiesterase [Kaistella jeonii]SFC37929.1 Acyl carrier protein phosphodiesterase [Kaistella jeonii]VEI96822.1 acyl carrier protein phosphodiesterase [Kaistella jeonii]
MNYLAHSFLAFSDEQIVGQFLEDVIPNRDRFSFSEKIQEGITLHREVDTFTDAHPELSEAKKIFSPLVRLYAGAFVDVSMDYFLANSLSDQVLKNHAEKVYLVLRKYESLLPEKLVRMVNGMEKDNWLYNYKEDWGIKYSMQNVLNKAKYLDKDVPVFEVFMNNKPQLKKHFDVFFPELLAHAEKVNSQF